MQTITQPHPPMPLRELLPAIKNFALESQHTQLDFLSQLVARHPILNASLRPMPGQDGMFWRARAVPKSYQALHVDDLIWRKGTPASPGRANPPGFSVLYLANKPHTAFAEIGIEDETVLLTAFSIRDGQASRCAPIGEFANMYSSNRGRLLGDRASEIGQFLNACDSNDLKALLITDSFLHRCMSTDVAPYPLSAHVAHRIFLKNKEVQAIVYPSTKLAGALNFAIRTDDFWTCWGIRSVSNMRVQHLAEQVYTESERRNAKDIDLCGGLQWGNSVDNPAVGIFRNALWCPAN
jgi:hypothetical protein